MKVLDLLLNFKVRKSILLRTFLLIKFKDVKMIIIANKIKSLPITFQSYNLIQLLKQFSLISW